MEIEIDKNVSNRQYLNELKAILTEFKIVDLLVKTISNDSEKIFQEVDHIDKSFRLIRFESLKVYLLMIDILYLNIESNSLTLDSSIDVQNIFVLLEILAKKSPQELESLFVNDSNQKHESIIKFVEVIYNLFVYFDESKQKVLFYEHKVNIANIIKAILINFKVEIAELCIRFGKILTMIAINERNTNLANGKELIQVNFF